MADEDTQKVEEKKVEEKMKKKKVSQEEFENLQQQFAQLQVQFEEVNNQLKRAVADYRNLEKRVSEGRAELSRWATHQLIEKLLPVLDHLEKALEGAREHERSSGWFKGVEMAVRELKSVLKDEGLDEIVHQGQFDPAIHEAVDTREGEENQILEVVRKGYLLQGKVLRPAQVVVGKLKVNGMTEEQKAKTVETGDYA